MKGDRGRGSRIGNEEEEWVKDRRGRDRRGGGGARGGRGQRTREK